MVGHNGRYSKWQSYRSLACYGWAKQPSSGVEGPTAGALSFAPSSVTHTSSKRIRAATAGRGCDYWTVTGLRPRSHWRTSAHKSPPTSKWSSQPPSADVRAPTHGGRRGGGVGGRPYAGLVRWLAWSGRWMSESVATHYGDALDDFVPADHVELPWSGAQRDIEWECRDVTLSRHFPGGATGPLCAGEGCGARRRPRGVEGCRCRPRIPGKP